MPSLRFGSTEGGTLHLRLTEPRLTTQMQQELQQEQAIRFSPEGMDFLSHDLVLPPDKSPCFFAWQQVEVLYEAADILDSPVQCWLNDKRVLHSGREDSTLFGSFSLQGAIGYSEIVLRTEEGRTYFRLQMEVFPQKLQYKADFQQMISDVNRWIHRLAFGELKRTYVRVSHTQEEEASLPEWIATIRGFMHDLEQSLNMILHQPNRQAKQQSKILPANQVRRLSANIPSWIAKHPQYLNRHTENGWPIPPNMQVSHLPSKDRVLTYDTAENRFVLWAIVQILDRLEQWDRHHQRLKTAGSSHPLWMKELQEFRQRLQQKRSHACFLGLHASHTPLQQSTVLTMAPGYREFYKRFLLLRQGLSISDTGVLKMDVKEVTTLYEYWCFLQIVAILREHPAYEMLSQDIVSHSSDHIVVRLQKGEASSLLFRHKKNRSHLRIWYNRPFGRQDSMTFRQVPDIVLEIEKPGYDQAFRFLIEVKYQFDRGSKSYPKNKIPYGPPLEAIAQLHRYRDAIVSHKQSHLTHQTAWKIIGGVVLFPFPDAEEAFRPHPFYQSIAEVDIGAIPLHPGSYHRHDLLMAWLNRLLDFSPEALYEQVIDYNRTEQEVRIQALETPVLILPLPEDTSAKAAIEWMQAHQMWVIPENKHLTDYSLIGFWAAHHQQIVAYSRDIEQESLPRQDLIDLGLPHSMIQDEQVFRVFRWQKMEGCSISFSSMSSLPYLESNLLAFEFARRSKQGDLLWLSSYAWFRAFHEIQHLSKRVTIKPLFTAQTPSLFIEFEWKKNVFVCHETEQVDRFQITKQADENTGQASIWRLSESLSSHLASFYRKTRR